VKELLDKWIDTDWWFCWFLSAIMTGVFTIVWGALVFVVLGNEGLVAERQALVLGAAIAGGCVSSVMRNVWYEGDGPRKTGSGRKAGGGGC
jgi:hypothetical protein